jgi:CRISPR/Cas system-associated exonuclease Cas4 (RecB family)
VEDVEYGDLEDLRAKLSGRFERLYGAVLYIDVSLETSQVSDVVIWEVRPDDLAQMAKFWRSIIREMMFQVPPPRPSWFCSYCSFVRKCAEVGL